MDGYSVSDLAAAGYLVLFGVGVYRRITEELDSRYVQRLMETMRQEIRDEEAEYLRAYKIELFAGRWGKDMRRRLLEFLFKFGTKSRGGVILDSLRECPTVSTFETMSVRSQLDEFDYSRLRWDLKNINELSGFNEETLTGLAPDFARENILMAFREACKVTADQLDAYVSERNYVLARVTTVCNICLEDAPTVPVCHVRHPEHACCIKCASRLSACHMCRGPLFIQVAGGSDANDVNHQDYGW